MSESGFSRTIHWDDPALKIFVPVQGEIPGDDGSTQVYESYENMSFQEFRDFKRARLDTAEGDIIRQWGALIDDSQITKDVTKCANPRAALISPNEAEASHGHALPRLPRTLFGGSDLATFSSDDLNPIIVIDSPEIESAGSDNLGEINSSQRLIASSTSGQNALTTPTAPASSPSASGQRSAQPTRALESQGDADADGGLLDF